MSTTAKPALGVIPTGAALGADVVGVDLARDLDTATIDAIQAAWYKHIVLRFRAQTISDDRLVAFSRTFGTLDLAPVSTTGRLWLPEYPELNVISNVIEDGKPVGGLGNGESEWHTDMSYKEEPPSASVLYGLEVPVGHGHTGFSNMYAALDALPSGLRQAIEGKSIRHDASTNSAGLLRSGFEKVTDPRQAPGAIHPAIRTHPVTKRKALFLGRRNNAYVLGMELAESEALLDALWAHAGREEFTWVQQWQPGDVIVWDNRCALHRRDAFDQSLRRLMHRAQVGGDKPF